MSTYIRKSYIGPCLGCSKKITSHIKSKKLCLSCRTLVYKYGITTDDQKKMLSSQKNRCKICGKHKKDCFLPTKGGRKGLMVDHDHATGLVRGLICINCNYMLGHAKDNPLIILSAFKYLKEHYKNKKIS